MTLVLDMAWIEDRCAKIPDTGCWLWMGRANTEGYGRIRSSGVAVHRLAFALSTGRDVAEMPRTVCVRHRCDTPSCVNPDHLIAGSWGDNIRDAQSRGRHAVAFREVEGKIVGVCKNGHDLAVAGIYDYGIQKSGYRLRVCLECKRANARAWAKNHYTPRERRVGA